MLTQELHTQIEKLIDRAENKQYDIDITTKYGKFILVINSVTFKCLNFVEIEAILGFLDLGENPNEKCKKDTEQVELKFEHGLISLHS